MRRAVAAVLGFLAAGACEQGEELRAVTLDTSGYRTAAGYLSCLEGKAAVVSAHRGGPAPGYPENAVETFEHTLSQIPALIETDVRETKDGVLVLLHDETVDRTTTGSGALSEMTLAEVKALRLVDIEGTETAFQVPTLQEALEAMRGRTVLQLDVKRGVGLSKVARAVKSAGAEEYAAIITYTDNGAVIAANQGRNLTVIAGASSMAEVRGLTDRGVAEEQLVIWVGVLQKENSAFWEQLGEKDLPTSGGALGRFDDRASMGAARVYADLEESGLDIIATDRPLEAAREIGTKDVEEAAAACKLPA
ncbi:glycerophosphodiester phosphodiesterase family protein [Parvularcula maris]|uniref:Glycerophosphodiester phosphodiesterase family protein n=1 Tax=Parvularcula maris TaxID=2965077 RepID=A0A9X2LAU9_9PROT|nr:glycerophosphodiester phosphodiesterase family protein [Parvularcula maris]MCQ8186176.1 glycerophosphodiester phosphodiesterase family protein [Parvularcula maris]